MVDDSDTRSLESNYESFKMELEEFYTKSDCDIPRV